MTASRHRRRLLRSLVLAAVGCILLAGARGIAPARAAAPRKNVLILNSYEPTYRWTANIVRGAQAVFEARDDVEVFVEYMDSKKAFTPEYARLLSEIYARKYHNLRFDLIVSSDDDALDFLKTYRDQLFPGVPVVFCGVNAFRDSRIAGFSNVTGVNEDGDLDKNIAWIAHLRPATKQLVFVFDQSATSAGYIHRLEDVEARWRNRFAFRVISNVTGAELQAQLRDLHDDAVVFWGMFMRDRAGRPLSMGESHRIILDAAPVPLFGLTDVSVSHGAVGGYVVSGNSQGETAARMGLRILDGTRSADVPIVRDSPNVYMLSCCCATARVSRRSSTRPSRSWRTSTCQPTPRSGGACCTRSRATPRCTGSSCSPLTATLWRTCSRPRAATSGRRASSPASRRWRATGT